MKTIIKHYSIARLARIGMVLLFAAVIGSCGGGGGCAGLVNGVNTCSGTTAPGTGAGTGIVIGAGTIQVVLVDAAGTATNSVTSGNPLTVKAIVTNGSGTPVKDQVVTFSVSSGIATISPSSGTALTDVNGVAQVNLVAAGTVTGAAEVTASVTIGTAAVTAKAAFSVGGATGATTTPTAVNFVGAIPADKSIVIKGAGGNGRTEAALLTFRVVDSRNNGVANVPVTFSTQSTNPVTLISTSGITDATGQVTVAVNSGTLPTTVRVIATVTGTTISTLSDQVTVTTGQPVQTAFTLGPDFWYVEGVDHNGITNALTVYLADATGGAVADGTPVVFTTDNGAIVGTGGARCLTAGGTGSCSVTWQSQNPRTANGIVTINATATNGTANLSVTTKFVNAGSFGRMYKVTLNSATGTWTRVTAAGGPIPLNFTASCAPQDIDVEIADINNNPMPEGTAISMAAINNASVVVFPATVKYNGAPIIGGSGGTLSRLTITPTGCNMAGTTPQTGSINMSIRSPLAGETFTRIDLGSFKVLP